MFEFYFCRLNYFASKAEEIVNRQLRASSHQFVKYIPLVELNGNQRLELGTLHLRQVLGRLVDEEVEELLEAVVRLRHDAAIEFCVDERLRRVASPEQLQPQKSNL